MVKIYNYTEEGKKRMSDAKKGIPRSQETREKISKSLLGNKRNLGIPHTEEQKRKISESLKGRTFSDESIKKMRGRIVSDETKQKMSGENNPSWKGGITPLISKIRNNPKYIQWRLNIFTRDNFACQECGDNKGGNLEAHHIKRFKDIKEANNIKAIEQALSCEELWDIHNGVTLCKNCHKSIHRKKVA